MESESMERSRERLELNRGDIKNGGVARRFRWRRQEPTSEVAGIAEEWRRSSAPHMNAGVRFERSKLVGAGRFELPTPTTPLWCATRLRYAPTGTTHYVLEQFQLPVPVAALVTD